MKRDGPALLLSATDLAGHLGCEHRTHLEWLRVEGKRRAPAWQDPLAEVLRERGLIHERAYLRHLAAGRDATCHDLRDVPLTADGAERTRAAMRAGAAAIAQAPLVAGRWRGIADVLVRVDEESDLGGWSYVVADTKLATETRAGTVLQLCLYSDVMATIQGRLPDRMWVVTPGRLDAPEMLRTRDFMAYYRFVRGRLEEALGATPPRFETYPEPVPLCETCRWWDDCNGQRRRDDHLSFVAGVSRLQRGELQRRDIHTVAALARTPIPFDPPPRRGSPASYERVREQARVQVASRGAEAPVVELLDVQPGLGLAALPEPSAGDVFLDLEGDPFVEGGGLEYLFGWVTLDGGGSPGYESLWALTPGDERRAFEALMDVLIARFDANPRMHVYHFGAYEPSALKRLMGRHATRAEELDRLLRGQRFVDLHAVVRQSLRIGVEVYGLKQLEAVHGYVRDLELREASRHKHALERPLELGEPDAIAGTDRDAVERYNRDDCISTWRLREWLEGVRAEQVAAGVAIERPAFADGQPPEELDERDARRRALAAHLAEGVPDDETARTPEQHARWLLANLLEFHRREDKASWWEFYRLAALPAADLYEEKNGLAGLELVGTVGGTERAPIHRYRFPRQDHDVRRGQGLHIDADWPIKPIGKVVAVDLRERTIDVKKSQRAASWHPSAVFAFERVGSEPIPKAIERLAEWVADHGVDARGQYRAGRDLLLRLAPRLRTGGGKRLVRDGEATGEAANRLALALDRGVLPIQGPPGTGKTYTGARMICALVAAGKKVGITAVSHKVIRNLLDEVLDAAREQRLALACVQKVSGEPETGGEGLTETIDNEAVFATLAAGEAQVGAGTAWLWARDDAFETLDVLVVDEAGQMSLANTLAAAQAARSIILLGDPQQLEQPIQGTHPPGCAASALEHLLQGEETIADDRGLFLPETWRLHPSICRFTSELFYDARLEAHPGRDRQCLAGTGRVVGAGLWIAPVEHEGNQTSSPEEVERVAALFDELVCTGARWTTAEGEEKPLGPDDVLVVAPYNAQVTALRERLPHARIGTVDKFQGQEAPVVIYSMATSSADEAPRGMEFVFSPNRLNVATSRARCACIIVASPKLFETNCRTVRQMRLVNALCRYRELAQVC